MWDIPFSFVKTSVQGLYISSNVESQAVPHCRSPWAFCRFSNPLPPELIKYVPLHSSVPLHWLWWQCIPLINHRKLIMNIVMRKMWLYMLHFAGVSCKHDKRPVACVHGDATDHTLCRRAQCSSWRNNNKCMLKKTQIRTSAVYVSFCNTSSIIRGTVGSRASLMTVCVCLCVC